MVVLKRLCNLLKKLPKNEELCFVGDLIDRGKDSKKVVDFVINNKHRCVLGNHEDMCLLSEESEHNKNIWVYNGGQETIKSFGGIVPSEIKDWFAKLPYKIEQDNYVISHSNAAAAIRKHDRKTFTIWNRELGAIFDDGKINIFGHTPMEEVFIDKHRIIVDTACVFGGYLSAYNTSDGSVIRQKNIE